MEVRNVHTLSIASFMLDAGAATKYHFDANDEMPA
jgi:hypothetical protein